MVAPRPAFLPTKKREGGETYRLVDDPKLLSIFEEAKKVCIKEFGKPQGEILPTKILFGQGPEIIKKGGKATIYLAPGDEINYLQLTGQLAHETFHLVCSPERHVIRWTHEMLAMLFQQNFQSSRGENGYVISNLQHLIGLAARIPQKQLTELTAESPYPDGIHGRSYLTGLALVSVTSWEAVKRLAQPEALKADGTPDLDWWLSTLEHDQAKDVNQILYT